MYVCIRGYIHMYRGYVCIRGYNGREYLMLELGVCIPCSCSAFHKDRG